MLKWAWEKIDGGMGAALGNEILPAFGAENVDHVVERAKPPSLMTDMRVSM